MACRGLLELIETLQRCQETPFHLDVWYEHFCDIIYSEMGKYVNKEYSPNSGKFTSRTSLIGMMS
jgi:hypothetical protein